MAVSAFIDVDAPGAERVIVHYGDDATRINATPELVPDVTGHVTAVILGLAPGAGVEVEVEVRAGSRVVRGAPFRFIASDLPPDVALPEVVIKADDGTATGYLLGAFVTPKGKVAAVLDRKGRVLWYRPLVGEAVGVFARMPNGNFIVYNWPARLFEEVDLAGSVVRRWVPNAPATEDGADGHEFLPLSSDEALVIGWQFHAVDSRPRFPKGVAKAERRDNTVVEMIPSGESKILWSSQTEVGIDEVRPVPEAEVDPAAFEIAHMNAIDVVGDDPLLLVTCRELEQVLGVDRTTGKVRWRLGGKRADLRVVGDPLGGVSAVHDARILPEHRIRVFDNGNSHKVQESRVVVYQIDEAAHEARFLWDYRHDPALYSWVGGSARDLPGGRLLVNFTWRGTITEIDAERRVRWEMRVPHSGAYRIEWVPTLYPPT